MDISILRLPDESKTFLNVVISAADNHKKELGFLPPAAYEAQADKGYLWILASISHEYLGHLMISGYRQSLKVTQLFIDPKFRHNGLAKIAIESLKEYATEKGYQYIQARVAADLSANNFWEKNGFIIVRQVKGGESTGRTINERAWFVPSMALFDAAKHGQQLIIGRKHSISKLPSYVLDTNIVIDYARKRAEFQNVELIIKKSINQELRVRSTPELVGELSRGTSGHGDDFAIRLAHLVPALSILNTSRIDTLIAELSQIVFSHRKTVEALNQNEKSDLVHLAYCIEHQQTGFVTRDGPILRAANEIGAKYGLEIVTPHDLVPEDAIVEDRAFESSESSGLLFSWVEQENIKELISNNFAEELQFYIRTIFPDWNSRQITNAKLLVVSSKKSTIGYTFVVWNQVENSWDIILSPIESFFAARSLMDETLQCVYSLCGDDRMVGVNVILAKEAIEIYQQILDNGFVICDACEDHPQVLILKRVVKRGVVVQKSWPELVAVVRRTLGWVLPGEMPNHDELVNTGVHVKSRGSQADNFFIKLMDFEKLIAPGIVVAKNRPAVLVPIKLPYARQLLPETEKTSDMLEGMDAGMYGERAYFSYSRASFPAVAGSAIVFYVSGQGMESGLAKAIASVTSVEKTTEKEARNNYLSRGVLTLKESDKSVTVVTFSNISVLKNPVPFNWMKEQGIISGAGLVTAQAITHKHLKAILTF